MIIISVHANAGDRINGKLIQFNDNGAWCWFQDERVIVDVQAGKLLIASTANKQGTGGKPRDGDIDIVEYDIATGNLSRFTLKHALTSYGGGDDHNAPALFLRPDGRYLAMYAGHNNNNLSYYRVSTHPHDATQWQPERSFDWNAHIPGGTDFPTTYSNLIYLEDESRLYNFARSDKKSPNIMYSLDQGDTWTYGGKLTLPTEHVGYVNGYFKYSSNGANRIHFIATEHHPRDFNTSLYHGFIEGGRVYNSAGEVLDDKLFDEKALHPDEFNPVFKAGTVVNGVTMTRAWPADLQVYQDGTLGLIFTVRADDSELDHRFLYARYDGADWSVTYLGKAGPKLWRNEEDYTGLGALDPNDPNAMYLSTPADLAGEDRSLDHHEIFKGTTADRGATWKWKAITEDSTADNLRPVVPDWDSKNTAVLWFRGTYSSQDRFDTAIVGVIEREDGRTGPVQ